MNFINNINNSDNNNIFLNSERYMVLKLQVTSNYDVNNFDILYNMYKSAADRHNEQMISNPFPDAGFDLFSPLELLCFQNQNNKMNFNVKCQATMFCESGKSYPTGFYMYPRSSTGSKSPLRLANSVGIIDSGYRGDLISIFDCVRKDSDNCDYIIEQYSKMVQICAPGLVPIYVEIVTSFESETVRGTGGFGSTNALL